jgi:hypothetical protein
MEEYTITLTDHRRIAQPLLDEHDRELRAGSDLIRTIERLGFDVDIRRD